MDNIESNQSTNHVLQAMKKTIPLTFLYVYEVLQSQAHILRDDPIYSYIYILLVNVPPYNFALKKENEKKQRYCIITYDFTQDVNP